MIARVILVVLSGAILVGCSGDQGQVASPQQIVQQNKAHQAIEEKGG